MLSGSTGPQFRRLAFVARRLLAESVAIVFATRTQGEERDLADLPELVVEGLRDPEARALAGHRDPGAAG